MADPQDQYPETATLGGREETDGDGEAALREALARNGADLAAALDASDELNDVLTTAILLAASADEDDLDHVTASTAALVEAVDGLTTAEAAALATQVGDNAGDLSATLDTVLGLERDGHIDDLATLAAAFSDALSPADVERLATMLEADGTALVEALDVVLDLQREGHLAALVDLAETLSALDVDEDAVEGLNGVLGAVGEARREARPVGILGLLRRLGGRDARAGLGYLLALLEAQGRRVRDR